MPRKAKSVDETYLQQGKEAEAELNAKRNKAITETQAQVEIIEAADQALAPYMDGKPYNEERLISEIAFLYSHHNATAFEIGKRLIILKSNTEHGQFEKAVLDRVGINRRYATSLMKYARTMIEANQIAGDKIDMKQLEQLDQRKGILLAEIIAENPEEVDDDGRIAGRTLDEWDCLNRKELQQKLREGLELHQAQADKIHTLQENVLEEQEKLKTLLSATPNAVCTAVSAVITKLNSAMTTFDSTAICNEKLPAHHPTISDLVGLRAQLRTFYEQLDDMIVKRFPAVIQAEVPTELDLTAPAPAKVLDAK